MLFRSAPSQWEATARRVYTAAALAALRSSEAPWPPTSGPAEALVDLAAAPDDWRGYTLLREIVITDDDWTTIPAGTRRALLSWVGLGGLLLVAASDVDGERLDRLGLQPGSDPIRGGPGDALRRSPERHHAALQRLERLLHHTGGIHFGDDLEAQLAVAHPLAARRAAHLQTLRFSATPWAFAFLREGMGRYPREQVRLSRPLPGDSWWHHPRAPHVLEPNAAADSHP